MPVNWHHIAVFGATCVKQVSGHLPPGHLCPPTAAHPRILPSWTSAPLPVTAMDFRFWLEYRVRVGVNGASVIVRSGEQMSTMVVFDTGEGIHPAFRMTTARFGVGRLYGSR